MGQIVAVKEKSQKVKALLAHYSTEIAEVLPRHLTPDRMISVMYAACTKTPKLLDCTPASLVTALKQASELGLEFNGVLGHAALIPYGNVATFQPMYKGLLDLAYRSGRVTKVDGNIVHENDEFSYSLGLHPDLKHVPALGERGEPIGAYVVAHIRDMEPAFKYMAKEEIERHRDRYSKAWRKSDSAWQTAPEAMWLKTVFIQLARWLPKSVEMANLEKAIQLDGRAELGMPAADDDAIDVGAVDITDTLEEIAAEMDIAADADDGLDALRESVSTMSLNMPDDIWNDLLATCKLKDKTISEMTKAELERVQAAIAAL